MGGWSKGWQKGAFYKVKSPPLAKRKCFLKKQLILRAGGVVLLQHRHMGEEVGILEISGPFGAAAHTCLTFDAQTDSFQGSRVDAVQRTSLGEIGRASCRERVYREV